MRAPWHGAAAGQPSSAARAHGLRRATPPSRGRRSTRAATCASRLSVAQVPQKWFDTAKLGFLFTAWFSLNVMYNITNKKCQNAFPMPWTMTVVSLFVGVPYILLLWGSGLRKAPKAVSYTHLTLPTIPLV